MLRFRDRVLRFRDLGVFVFEFWVLRFRDRVLRFRDLGALCFGLRFRNYLSKSHVRISVDRPNTTYKLAAM